jgi:hypothetical protein
MDTPRVQKENYEQTRKSLLFRLRSLRSSGTIPLCNLDPVHRVTTPQIATRDLISAVYLTFDWDG